MFAKIVVPYDGSAYSVRALDTGIEIARRFGSELTVLTVVPRRPNVGEAPGVPARIERREVEAYRSLAERAAETARAAGLPHVAAEVREGVIVEEILGFLESDRTDLVIVGSRGQSAFRGLLLGSVSEAVTHHAKCTVIVEK